MTRAEHKAFAKSKAHQKWLSGTEALIQRSAELHSRIVRMAPVCTIDQRLYLHGEIALTATILEGYEHHILKAAAGIRELNWKQTRVALAEERKEQKRLPKPTKAVAQRSTGVEVLPAAPKRLTAGGAR